jgi:tRNA nucleotidyltransferase (CCA-adding enzyme)
MPAYAVGGCVRDWWLKSPDRTDVDVTVEGDGIGAARAIARAFGGTVNAHQQFGTATVTLGSRRVDFATCRRESYAKPAAYPMIEPGTLEEDLFRRDFTMNAMAVALSPGRFGLLMDPFRGADDLARRQLRILHERSFLDDPSRILRGIRFLERFHLRWEPDTECLMRDAMADGALGRLNPGRLQKELDRMLEEPDPSACLQRLAAYLRSSRRP